MKIDKRRYRRVVRKWGKTCPDNDEECAVCKAWYYFYTFNMIL